MTVRLYDGSCHWCCPLCHIELKLETRTDQQGMKLTHTTYASIACPNNGKVVYAPMREFEELPKEFQ